MTWHESDHEAPMVCIYCRYTAAPVPWLEHFVTQHAEAHEGMVRPAEGWAAHTAAVAQKEGIPWIWAWVAIQYPQYYDAWRERYGHVMPPKRHRRRLEIF